MRKIYQKGLASLILANMCLNLHAQPAQNGHTIIHGTEGDSTTPMELTGEAIVLKEGKAGVFSTQIVGSLQESGVYVTRVRLAPNAKNDPHFHPDGRFTTVIAGTIYYGRGNVVDTELAHVFHAGDVYYTPAETAHWLYAGADGAVYDEVGFGPSSATPVAPNK